MTKRNFPKALAFQPISIGPNGEKAFKAFAYTAELTGDQVVVAGPDADTAYRRATSALGPHIDRDGVQEVVIVSAASFKVLLDHYLSRKRELEQVEEGV